MKEGRLKPPSFKGRQAKYGLCGQRLQTSCRGHNDGIPLAGARRLRPCPRKASARSDPGRRELHYLAASNPTVTSQFIDFVSKLTILFGGVGNCCPKL